MRTSLALVVLCSVFLKTSADASASEGPTVPVGVEQKEVKFTQMAPYADDTNLTKHFGYRIDFPAYAITNETFQVLIPGTYSTNKTWGLLVWISPSDDPMLPPDWKAELENRGLLFVSAHHSGNERHPMDRFRLALDATCNICRQYKVDRQRIYLGGFSGGSRMASMLGVAYADIFAGTLCVCGVNFYTSVAASGGKYFPAMFVPDPGTLLLAKRSRRFVLLTGEHDENRENTQAMSTNGFKREGFRHVLYLEVPGMAHAMPDANVFRKALDFLSGQTE
jgi:predicted esterase